MFERSCLYEAGKRSNGNGNRPSEKPLGASEQYIEYQKATIELIQKGRGREGKGRERRRERGHVRLAISPQVALEVRHGKEMYPHFGLMMVSNAT